MSQRKAAAGDRATRPMRRIDRRNPGRGRRAGGRVRLPVARWQRRARRSAGPEAGGAAREALASVALGEKAVVPDAVEAVGQDVEQETPDELVWGEAHDAGAPPATIVLVGERDFIVVDGDKPRIGDRRAMRVAGEIGQYPLGAAEGRLGVDDEGARRRE